MKRVEFLLALGVALAVWAPRPVMAADVVKFTLNCPMTSEHTGFQVTIDKGFFKEKGLDVDLTCRFGSGEMIKWALGRKLPWRI